MESRKKGKEKKTGDDEAKIYMEISKGNTLDQ